MAKIRVSLLLLLISAAVLKAYQPVTVDPICFEDSCTKPALFGHQEFCDSTREFIHCIYKNIIDNPRCPDIQRTAARRAADNHEDTIDYLNCDGAAYLTSSLLTCLTFTVLAYTFGRLK